jgi:hypothetical protein
MQSAVEAAIPLLQIPYHNDGIGHEAAHWWRAWTEVREGCRDRHWIVPSPPAAMVGDMSVFRNKESRS